jgi:hypothetical protein
MRLWGLLRHLHLNPIPFGDALEVVGQYRVASVINIGIDGPGRRDLRQQEATDPEKQDSKDDSRGAIESETISLISGNHLIAEWVHHHKYTYRAYLID